MVYSNSLFNDFVYDDKYLIVNNPYIKDVRFIDKVFSKSIYDATCEWFKTDYYRPLQAISIMLDYRLWGLNPFGYHLTNVFIHFLNSLLAYYLLYLTFNNFFIASAASIIFCVHPINTTVVTYIAGRADLLAGLFMLSVFLCTVLSLRYNRNRKLLFFLIILFSVLSLLSRESALVIPLVIILLSVFIKADNKFKAIIFIITTLLVILYLFLRINLLGMSVAGYLSLSLKPYLMIINFIYLAGNYIILLILPINLRLMHTLGPILYPHDIRIWVVLAAFTALAIYLYIRRKDKIFLFGSTWFFIFIIQAAFVMTKFAKNRLSIGEHWVYLASIGFYLLIGYGLYCMKKYLKYHIYIIIGLILVVYSAITTIDNINFKNDLILSKYILRLEPDNVETHKVLADIYLFKKEYKKALDHLSKAMKMNSSDPDIYFLRARYYNDIQDYGMAVSAYEEVLKKAPNSARANNNLGAIYFDKGDYARADKFFKKAIAFNPLLSESYLNLGRISHKNNNIDEAVNFYKKAISLNPEHKDALIALANIYIEKKQFKEALSLLRSALASGHKIPEIFLKLGLVNGELGYDLKALHYFKEVLKVDPNNTDALLNIGVCYTRLNELAKAIEIWGKALKIDPLNKAVEENIAKAKALLQDKK